MIEKQALLADCEVEILETIARLCELQAEAHDLRAAIAMEKTTRR